MTNRFGGGPQPEDWHGTLDGARRPVSVVADRLRSSGSDALAVTDQGRVVGVVTLRDVASVEVLLDRLTNEAT